MRRLLVATSLCLPLFVAIACGSAGGTDDASSQTGASGGSAAGGSNGTSGSGGAGGASGKGGNGITGTDGGTLDPDAACAKGQYAANRVPASLLVLLDRSGSMSDGGKWEAAVAAITSMVDKGNDELGVGLLRFPEGKFDDSGLGLCALNPSTAQCKALFADGGCKDISTTPQVEVGPLKTTRAQIKSVLKSTSPTGGTPTRWALKNAWAYQQKLQTNGERYVLLVTDGLPQTHEAAMGPPLNLPESNVECGVLADIGAETTAAKNGTPPVKTFVIGAPGSETDPKFLSGVAYNGGTGKPGCVWDQGNCHFQIGSANFEKDLEAVLTEIAGKIASCVFEVPKSPDADPKSVNVTVTTTTMGEVTLYRDASHKDGWDYTDASSTKIEIFGAQCDAIKGANTSAQVQILFGCKTQEK